MMPFWPFTAGGNQLTLALLGLLTTERTLVGEELGAVDKEKR